MGSDIGCDEGTSDEVNISNNTKVNWWKSKRVTVTGGRGFLGRPLTGMLMAAGADVTTFSSKDYNLTSQAEVARMYRDQRPEVVVHLAARVGGIGANRDNPGSFFYDNAIMGIELMEQARQTGVSKFVQVGTVCSYPKFAPIPFTEDDLWNGYPRGDQRAIWPRRRCCWSGAGIQAAARVQCDLLGPGQPVRPRRQLRPAQLACHPRPDPQVPRGEAGRCAVRRGYGGTGTPTREFLYVDDAARGIMLAA